MLFVENKKMKLTNKQIEKLIEQQPEILEKIILDLHKAKIINEHFKSFEIKKIIALQLEEKILPTLQIKS